MIREPVKYTSSKTKKPSLSSFLLALPGERCARAGICWVVEREPFFLNVLGFRFTTSQIPCHA